MPAKKKTEKVVEEGIKGEVKKTQPKGDNVSLFTLAVVTIIILGVIGIVFGYTKDKLNQLQGNSGSAALEEQVKVLKNELKDLSDKTQALEKINAENKEIVANLFDNNRKLPSDVDTSDWVTYTNSEANINLQLPTTWEILSAQKVASGDNSAPADGGEVAEVDAPVLPAYQHIIVIQPKGQPSFARAVTLKDDYLDFSTLSQEEKYDIIKELHLLDERDFGSGKILYFIDLDDAENEIPTILILTDNRILRATFNVYNKTIDGYIQYRQEFEQIITTLDLPAAVEAALADDSKALTE